MTLKIKLFSAVTLSLFLAGMLSACAGSPAPTQPPPVITAAPTQPWQLRSLWQLRSQTRLSHSSRRAIPQPLSRHPARPIRVH